MQTSWLLLISWLLGSLPLVAQPWRPLLPQHHYHYQPTGDSLVISLWVDSAQAIGTDSMWYFNTRAVLPPPDSFAVEIGIPARAPHFLMKKFRQQGDSLFVLSDTSTFALKPYAVVGNSWTFDSVRNLTATLEARKDTVLWGQSDSLLRIRLSDGHRVDWSREHGILYWPGFAADRHAWRLVGIEGAKPVGIQVPVFADFFQWQVGDQMEYESGFSSLGGYRNVRSRLEVLARQTSGDTLRFRLRRVYREQRTAGPGVEIEVGVDTTWVSLIDSAAHPTNQYSWQPFGYAGVNQLNGAAQPPIGVVQVFRHPDGQWSKQLGGVPGGNSFVLYTPSTSTSDSLYGSDYGYPNGYERYCTRLGLRGFDYSLAESRHDSVLIAYRTATDSMGSLTPDSMLLSVRPSSLLAGHIDLFPNPVRDRLTLRWQGDWSGEALALQLIDGQGRLLRTIHWQPTQRPSWFLDLSPLVPGVYLLRSATHPWSQRIIKR